MSRSHSYTLSSCVPREHSGLGPPVREVWEEERKGCSPSLESAGRENPHSQGA